MHLCNLRICQFVRQGEGLQNEPYCPWEKRGAKRMPKLISSMRSHLFASACALYFCAAASSVASVSAAGLEEAHQFSIEAQALDLALVAFSRQADVQVITASADLKSLRTQGVSGGKSVADALRQLLAGTGLTFRQVGDNTVAIEGSGGASGSQQTKAEPEETGPQSGEKAEQPVEKVVVTGSRLPSRNKTRATLTTFDRQKIDQLGAASIANTLAYAPQQPFTDVGDNLTGGGARFARLRGLNVDHTLLLINGRRAFPGANSLNNALDLNSIPLAVVERIEILSDSASAVYGSDAIGGVVNIILRTDVPHPTLDLHFGTAEDGAEETGASFSVGHTSETWRVAGFLDFFHRSSLLSADRDISADQDYRRYGGVDGRIGTANPANITSLTTANLPGLPSRTAVVPNGSNGIGLTPADFLGTAGQRNLENILTSSIIPETTRYGAGFFGEVDVSDATLFAEVLYSDIVGRTMATPATFAGNVPASNPFNPFGVSVRVEYLFEELGPRVLVLNQDGYRAVTGIRGSIGSWNGELSVLHSDFNGSQYTEGALDAARVTSLVNATDPATALNFFRDGGPAAAASVLASLRSSPVTAFASTGTQVSGFVSGELFALPAGPIEAVLGAEWREEGMDSSLSSFRGSREVSATFAEMRVPLIEQDQRFPLAEDLSLSIAARYDNYSDAGSTFNPQFGVNWTATDGVFLHASWSQSFRAPSLFELYFARTTSPSTIADPRRGNESYVTNLTFGGSPTLDPTTAESYTLGTVLTPFGPDAIRFSASYWHIAMEDRVFAYTGSVLLANESLFPDRILRAAPSPADIAAGRPGQVIQLDTSRVNFGPLITSGVDLGLVTTFDIFDGQMTPSLTATWVESYDSQDLPGVPSVDRVGVVSRLGTIPRWRAVSTLQWTSGGLSLSGTARYVSGLDDINSSGLVNGRRIASQTIIDAQTSLTFDKFAAAPQWLDGVRLSLGVQNLFDEEPEGSAADVTGYDRGQGDIRGRFGYVNLSKAF